MVDWPMWGCLAAELANGLPAGVGAGFPSSAPDSFFWPHLLKVGGVLAGLLGLLVLVQQLARKWRSAPGESPPLIRVLATHYVAPKQVLLLVAVGREQFLLASAPDRLTLLTALPLRREEGHGEADGTLPLLKLREKGAAETC